MKKTTTHRMVKMAFMTAISVILFYFEFPMPGSPLQFDLSDLPVIFTGYLLGFGPGVMVALLKNIVHALFISRNAGIVGELANFMYAVVIMLPIALIRVKGTGKTILLCTFTVLYSSFLMLVLNYYITFPLYGLSQVGAWGILFSVYLPFNLIKGSILMLLYYISMPLLNRLKV